MVGGQGNKFGGKRGAAEIRELIRVQLDWQSKRPCSCENPYGLLTRERDTFHEGVNGVGESGLRYGRQHVSTNEVDEAVLVAARFRRQCVCSKKRGLDRHGSVAAQCARSRELTHLGFGVESITGLDLKRRHALVDQRGEPR